MSLVSITKAMLERFGDRVEIISEDDRKEIRAVVQPLLYKNKMYLSGTLTDAGYFDRSHFLMIAPADTGVENWKDIKVLHSGVTYTVRKVEVISALELDLYLWAVLVPYFEEMEDDYEKLQ